jgi:hypothetical protein
VHLQTLPFMVVALAQKDGGRRAAVRDGLDMHAATGSGSGRAVQIATANSTAMFSRFSGVCCPNFGRSVVVTGKGLGLIRERRSQNKNKWQTR